MWRKKRLAVIALLAIVVLAGTIGGIAAAQDSSTDDTAPVDRCGALLDRVAEAYEANTGVALDLEALKNAFVQAQADMRAQVLENHLQGLVDRGVMTQDEADQYLGWWQARPDVPLAGLFERGFGAFGGHGLRGMCGMWGR